MLDVRSRHRHGKFLALASPTLQTGIEMGVGKGGVYRSGGIEVPVCEILWDPYPMGTGAAYVR